VFSRGWSLERLKISRSAAGALTEVVRGELDSKDSMPCEAEWAADTRLRNPLPKMADGLLGVNVSKPNGTRKVQGPGGADPILDRREIQLFPMFTTRTQAGPS